MTTTATTQELTDRLTGVAWAGRTIGMVHRDYDGGYTGLPEASLATFTETTFDNAVARLIEIEREDRRHRDTLAHLRARGLA